MSTQTMGPDEFACTQLAVRHSFTAGTSSERSHNAQLRRGKTLTVTFKRSRKLRLCCKVADVQITFQGASFANSVGNARRHMALPVLIKNPKVKFRKSQRDGSCASTGPIPLFDAVVACSRPQLPSICPDCWLSC